LHHQEFDKINDEKLLQAILSEANKTLMSRELFEQILDQEVKTWDLLEIYNSEGMTVTGVMPTAERKNQQFCTIKS